MIKLPAHNERFHASGSKSPRKRQCKLAKEYPAGSFVESATSRSRWDVGCKFVWTVYPEKQDEKY